MVKKDLIHILILAKKIMIGSLEVGILNRPIMNTVEGQPT